jgi:hypothetical protein
VKVISHGEVAWTAILVDPTPPLGIGRRTNLWEGLQQIGNGAQVLYLPCSRAVVGKGGERGHEPACTPIVVEPRPPLGSWRFAHLSKGLDQTGSRAQVW